MFINYHQVRDLYDELVESDDEPAVLDRWVPAVVGLLRDLEPMRHRDGSWPTDDNRHEALYAMYAISRVSDVLLERGRTDLHSWFFTRIGMRPFELDSRFSPFHHEIVDVVPDPNLSEARVRNVLWQGFYYGDLLFSRAGVQVQAPAELVAEAAATTTLYFTFRRGPRRTHDLSHGWGHNSQWRTEFTRYYADADGLHLNWDGSDYLGENHPDSDLPLERRRELLLHRGFVVEPLPPNEHDYFPFEDRISLRTDTWPLPADAVLPDLRS